MTHTVRILKKEPLNHDVIRFLLEKPAGFTHTAGQAIELSLPGGPLAGKPAPFTLTSVDGDPSLELMIKIYRDHKGITAELERQEPGNQVIISDAWDSYVDRGPGVFLAGGAGATPFIALLRHFRNLGRVGESALIFSNKTEADIFGADEFRSMLGQRYVDVLTHEHRAGFPKNIDADLIRRYAPDPSVPFYVCGPPGFIDHVNGVLATVGVAQNLVVVSL